MTRYLLCQDVIFNKMTDKLTMLGKVVMKQKLDKQINDFRFQAPDHDKIIGQRHDPYDPELV